MVASSNPVLVIIAILLTLMSSYAALDLFLLLNSAKQKKRLLFLGSTLSMGIGIGVMNFFGMLSANINGVFAFYLPIALLSMVLGISFSGMAFYSIFGKNINFSNLIVASIFMTMAVLSNHVIGMYTINFSIQYNVVIMILSILLVFAAFLFSFWILLYTNNFTRGNHFWLKPVSALIMAAGIVEGHFLLIRATIFEISINPGFETATSQTFLIYLILFVSMIILVGLISSSALISKRLAISDTYLKDITTALDESSIVAITDPKGKITFVNDKFLEISKYEKSELLGKDHRILNSGFHSKEFFLKMWKEIGQGRVWKGEIRNKAKDGTFYWVATTIVPFLNEKGKPYQYLAIRNDITEQKKTEETLHRHDKLAAVGQLAAGIAHEIRNPLTSMKGYTEFLQLDEKNPERLEYLDIILDEIERVNSIVEEFMVLAKPKADLLEEKNVVQIMKNVLSLLNFEARKKHVRVHFNSCDQIIQVECDEDRIKQVFLNLVKNGIEAMPNGGDLYVNLQVQNNNVQISIQDTGIGISKEKMKKIGEPFYTTKENGNGLGLMVSFKIIESHNGKIYIESEENIGTTFNIVLPAKPA